MQYTRSKSMSEQAVALRSIDCWLAEYGESHEDHTNELIHWICVPAIMFSVLLLLRSISWPAALGHVYGINWATLMLALAGIYYLTLSIPLALGMVLVNTAMY